MSASFLTIAIITLAGAIGAVALRNLVHCALCLTVSFAGLAAFYLQLQAQFVGLAQILVYIGAVAILIVFAILLTRNSETAPRSSPGTKGLGIAIAALVFGVFLTAIVWSSLPNGTAVVPPELTTRNIGEKLMHQYVLPLEAVALLLTAALIGGVLIALPEENREARGDRTQQ